MLLGGDLILVAGTVPITVSRPEGSVSLQVIVPEQASRFKECYIRLAADTSSDYAVAKCRPYVEAMRDALQKRHCNPL